MQENLDFPNQPLDRPPQRVCVTAGGSGLGLTIVEAFQEAGARVHLSEPDPKILAEALGQLPGVHGSVADVSRPVEVQALFDEALSWMGGLDVLVNCTSSSGPRAHLEDIEDDAWDQTIATNLSGAFYCTRHAARAMRQQRSGVILNIASTAARTGLPMRSAFVASMSGLLGLTHNVARELGPDNIRCNAVLPGILDNDGGRDLVRARARQQRRPLEEVEAELLSHTSMRAWIAPREVADMVLFLASDRACHISGQSIGVCGNVEWEG